MRRMNSPCPENGNGPTTGDGAHSLVHGRSPALDALAPPAWLRERERERVGVGRVDRPAAERAVADLLRALGRDPGDAQLVGTPRRVAAAFAELLSHDPFELTTFPNDDGYDELVVVRDIPFHSLCMHHLLPFHGVAHVAYLPGERIIGLSKLARVVEVFARDLQLQERLTMQVAGHLQAELRAQGRRRADRGRAHVHVPARGAEGRRPHDDIGAARAVARRRADTAGVSVRHADVRRGRVPTLLQVMSTPRPGPPPPPPGIGLRDWRRRRLAAAGFAQDLAGALADEPAVDLHELLVLLDRGCPPALAARILAPLESARR